MAKLGWVYHNRFLDHETGNVHIERADRLSVIERAIQDAGLLADLTPLSFRQASADELALLHDPAYIDIVRMVCDEGFQFIGSADTVICPASYDVAALAVGGVLAACDAVVSREISRVFCAVRPPGHHAEIDQAMGFCLFNNVALGAEYLLRHHRFERLAIVDIDAHHGNGTQHFFEGRKDVFYASLHEIPGSLTFPGTGFESERGVGAGLGYTLNATLARGSNGEAFCIALDEYVLPALRNYRPEIILMSTGFDALMWDNVANLSLEPDDFGAITQRIASVADHCAQGRIISVLEGGYDLANLGRAAVAHVRALLAHPGR